MSHFISHPELRPSSHSVTSKILIINKLNNELQKVFGNYSMCYTVRGSRCTGMIKTAILLNTLQQDRLS